MCREHRARCVSDQTLGDTAKQHVRKAAPSVRAHDDQVDLLFARELLDDLCRPADTCLDRDGEPGSLFSAQRAFEALPRGPQQLVLHLRGRGNVDVGRPHPGGQWVVDGVEKRQPCVKPGRQLLGARQRCIRSRIEIRGDQDVRETSSHDKPPVTSSSSAMPCPP